MLSKLLSHVRQKAFGDVEMRRRRRVVAAMGIIATAAAATATPAMGDSLAFIRDNNVWLANPDGSGQYQVTLDGTAGSPYETPSQADNGTVVAIRQTPGQRRQIYRMTQNGGLLNAPINTPAPGTGAIDGKVSPNGALVAYWFVTTVNDPLCPFCVNVSNRALLSHSDRFTNYNEVGTPNTGGWPSWIGDDTIVIGNGSATQWYYRLGMSEAAEWFADSDFVTENFQTLLDAEAAPTGDRLAVVRGNNQETILLLKMNGPPPNKPTIANATCNALTGPAGKFVDPTWSTDGRLLAWQEDNGVWTMPVPADLGDCAGFGTPALRIPGARNPDLSPAPINPGPRPPCGNPGNPTCIDRTAPSISAFSLTNRRFRIAGRATPVSARRRAPLGTTFRYTLSEPATVTLTIKRALPGRRVGSSCRRPTRSNRNRRRCTRYVRAGVLTRRNKGPGRVSTPFTGRIGTRKLALGSYRATLGATDAAGNRATTRQTTFTIVL
jgi:hypothetical protein